MVIYYSYVKLPEGTPIIRHCASVHRPLSKGSKIRSETAKQNGILQRKGVVSKLVTHAFTIFLKVVIYIYIHQRQRFWCSPGAPMFFKMKKLPTATRKKSELHRTWTPYIHI